MAFEALVGLDSVEGRAAVFGAAVNSSAVKGEPVTSGLATRSAITV